MNEYAAILGTLAGVLAGGLVNFFATRKVKNQEWRWTLARDQLNRRQDLYGDFLAEIQRLTAQAIYKDLEIPNDVHALDRLIAQMTLLSPDPVLDAARELRRHLLRKPSAASETVDDRPTFNQLSRGFLAAAKTDIQSYRNDA